MYIKDWANWAVLNENVCLFSETGATSRRSWDHLSWMAAGSVAANPPVESA